MASYEDLQSALVRFGNAQERYWTILEGHARTIRDGLTEYLGKAGKTTEINGLSVPYVELGEGAGDQFTPIMSPSKLPADGTALEFSIRVVIESPNNRHFKIASTLAVEMSQRGEKLNITLGEYGDESQLSFPEEFNERHQTQLFDAITSILIRRLDVSKFV